MELQISKIKPNKNEASYSNRPFSLEQYCQTAEKNTDMCPVPGINSATTGEVATKTDIASLSRLTWKDG